MKSLVVHLADEPHATERLAVGTALAKRLGAHLDAVYTVPPPMLPPGSRGRAASQEYLVEMAEAAREKAQRASVEAETYCRSAGLAAWAWHQVEGDEAETLIAFARTADLVILGQVKLGRLEDLVTTDNSERLLQDGGCPLLLIPATWGDAPVGRRVLIGWNRSKEAIAAVRDALGLLAAAETVVILPAEKPGTAAVPGADLVLYLGRHGIEATPLAPSEGSDEALIEAAKRHGCDLVVMGSFGHSRFAEVVWGGVTAFMLRHSSIPVLMRH